MHWLRWSVSCGRFVGQAAVIRKLWTGCSSSHRTFSRFNGQEALRRDLAAWLCFEGMSYGLFPNKQGQTYVEIGVVPHLNPKQLLAAADLVTADRHWEGKGQKSPEATARQARAQMADVYLALTGWVLLSLYFVSAISPARSCGQLCCCWEENSRFHSLSQISAWLRKHGAIQIEPINHLDWLLHFLQAAKALININCWRFLTLLEKFSRLLVEQKLTRTQGMCWSPKAEEWRGPQGTEPQPSVHKPPRDSWCAGRERNVNSQKGKEKQPRESCGGIGGQ